MEIYSRRQETRKVIINIEERKNYNLKTKITRKLSAKNLKRKTTLSQPYLDAFKTNLEA